MRAVNLIPGDERGGAVITAGRSGGGIFVVARPARGLALLALLYGLADRQISQRQRGSRLAHARAAAGAGARGRAGPLHELPAMREQRVQAVTALVDSRFDWAHDLPRTRARAAGRQGLARLDRTARSAPPRPPRRPRAAPAPAPRRRAASPVTSATPPGSVPVFTLTGCATSQAEVALMLERLRLIDGVSEVTLQSSTKSGASSSRWRQEAAPAAQAATPPSPPRSPSTRCRPSRRPARARAHRPSHLRAPPRPPLRRRRALPRARPRRPQRRPPARPRHPLGGGPMTGRDRIVVDGPRRARHARRRCGCWPSRPSANRPPSSPTEVSAAQAQLATAESQVASASAAQARYEAAYASIVQSRQSRPRQPGSALADLSARAGDQPEGRRIRLDHHHRLAAPPAPGRAPRRAPPRRPAPASPRCRSRSCSTAASTASTASSSSSTASRCAAPPAMLRVSGRLLTIQSIKLAPRQHQLEHRRDGVRRLRTALRHDHRDRLRAPGRADAHRRRHLPGPTGAATQAASTGLQLANPRPSSR